MAQFLVPNELVEKTDPETGKKSGGLKATRALVNRLMSIGFILGVLLGSLQILILPMIHKFTPIKAVQDAARAPSYIASFLQIINGLVSTICFFSSFMNEGLTLTYWVFFFNVMQVFIGEGVMIGCSNFLTLSLSTVVATIGILGALRVFPQKYGVAGVWMGFGVFNILRLLGVIVHQTRVAPIAERNIQKS